MTPLERYAHDLVCVIKYGSPGGTATKNEIKRTMEYLTRMGAPPAPELPRVVLPKIPGSNPPPPVGVVRPLPPPNPPPPTIAVRIPIHAPEGPLIVKLPKP